MVAAVIVFVVVVVDPKRDTLGAEEDDNAAALDSLDSSKLIADEEEPDAVDMEVETATERA